MHQMPHQPMPDGFILQSCSIYSAFLKLLIIDGCQSMFFKCIATPQVLQQHSLTRETYLYSENPQLISRFNIAQACWI